jgi:hypothetical protein
MQSSRPDDDGKREEGNLSPSMSENIDAIPHHAPIRLSGAVARYRHNPLSLGDSWQKITASPGVPPRTRPVSVMLSGCPIPHRVSARQ